MPALGIIHHKLFKHYQRRTFWSYAHIWLGRTVITLGIINGGLGFLLANNTRSGPIAYGVIAGIMWLIYVTSAIIGERKRAKVPAGPPKYTESPPSGHSPSRSNPETREFYGQQRK